MHVVASGRSIAAGGLRLERVASFDGLRAEWDELAEATANVFSTWEWARVWWRHFGGDRPLLLTTCRAADGGLVAVLPLYLSSTRPLRIVRFVGHGPGDQLGPVCRPADREQAGGCLLQALADIPHDLFIGEHMLREEGWSVALGGRVLATESTPVRRLDAASWDELLAGLGPSVRKKIRQYERKLEQERRLRYRPGGDDLDAELDVLFALHRARWPTSAYAGAHAPFHRDFAHVARERGWLRLWLLEADDRPVAAWCGFRFAGVDSSYQCGRDPSWKGPSVGSVLQAHTIRAALADGMREYRFLRGGEEYKYRFATHDPGLETLGLAGSRLGHAALAADALLPPQLTRRLRRKLAG